MDEDFVRLVRRQQEELGCTQAPFARVLRVDQSILSHFYGGHRRSSRAAVAVLESGRRVQCWPMSRFLSVVRQTYQRGGAETEAQLVSCLAGTPMLILDDLGKEYVTDRILPWLRNLLFQVVDRRWVEGRAMLVTSNHSPEALEDLLGGALCSRLFGMFGDRVVQIRGPDRRMGG